MGVYRAGRRAFRRRGYDHAAFIRCYLWLWTQRTDVKPENLCVGCWQASRGYNLLCQPENARMHGLLALKHAAGLNAFCHACDYETLARAEMQAGNRKPMTDYLEKAKKMGEQIQDQEDRQLLLRDLATIR